MAYISSLYLRCSDSQISSSETDLGGEVSESTRSVAAGVSSMQESLFLSENSRLLVCLESSQRMISLENMCCCILSVTSPMSRTVGDKTNFPLIVFTIWSYLLAYIQLLNLQPPKRVLNMSTGFNNRIPLRAQIQNMKRKSKASKSNALMPNLSDFPAKDISVISHKKPACYLKRFKFQETNMGSEVTRDPGFTRRLRSPEVKSLAKQKSKGNLISDGLAQMSMASMKSTPNKSLALIQYTELAGKHKAKNRASAKLASQAKTVSTLGHRKSKSQQFLTSKAINYDMFITRSSHPRSLIKCSSQRTRAGVHSGKQKINQDALINQPYFLTHQSSFFGVCDGHGVNGHLVSQIVKHKLPLNLEFFLGKNKVLGSQDINVELVEYSIKMAFKKTECDLMVSEVDIDLSGSTCVAVFTHQANLWCSNLGDSRAMLFSEVGKDRFTTQSLSHDHKGQDPVEAKRINGMGGILESYVDDQGQSQGPLRVWIPGKNIPGLAMTRSFGDSYASTVGVTSDPEIIYRKLKEQDKFMVIASDGLWEFVDGDTVLGVVKDFYKKKDIDGATKALQRLAIKAWQDEDQTVDDITIIVVYFDSS